MVRIQVTGKSPCEFFRSFRQEKGFFFFSFKIFSFRASKVAQWSRIRLPMWETQVRSLGQEDPQGEEMAIYSSILVWEIP